VKQIILKNNQLRFSAFEDGSGPLVLCLHGFPDNYHSYDQQIPTLVDAGYRVVVPMMRGYEAQSQPADGDYHLNLMVEDVLTWVDQLGEEKVHLVGHDWGAVIGYLTANTVPDRLLSLTTFAIPPLQGLSVAIRIGLVGGAIRLEIHREALARLVSNLGYPRTDSGVHQTNVQATRSERSSFDLL
jgi:pimeloyl-ACP methyl ester carboxylesterase